MYQDKSDWEMQPQGRWPANLIHDGSSEVAEVFARAGESGESPARFFYTAKASRSERQQGLSDGIKNNHPTVKPLALCEYLARLIVPPEPYRDDARLLVPFCGSGSEIIGAIRAGWRNVDGIELNAEYIEIARRRIEHWQAELNSD